MSMTHKHWLALPLAGIVLALGGCATTTDSGSTTTTRSSTASTMGGGSSPYMQTGASPSGCMKYDIVPPECERALAR